MSQADDDFDPKGFRFVDIDPRAFEEEQLAAAIAASLADAGADSLEAVAVPDSREIISLTDSSPSSARGSPEPPTLSPTVSSSKVATSTAGISTANATTSTNSFMQERAALERARLERQRKLKQNAEELDTPGASSSTSVAPIRSESPKKRAREESDEIDGIGVKRALKAVKTSQSKYADTSILGVSDILEAVLASSSTSRKTSKSTARFWGGEIRRTPSPFNTNPTFSLPGIIGDTEDLEWGIMSAMDVDFDWVSTAYPRSKPLVIVSSPARNMEFTAATVNRLTTQWANPTPKMLPGSGVMHSKVFVFFYKSGYARVAVNTANLLDFDWWRIENTSWVQDFPLKPNAQTLSGKDASADDSYPQASKFVESLIRMLRGMNVEGGIKTLVDDRVLHLPTKSSSLETLLERYDFSKVKVALVCSLPGKFKRAEMQTVGHTGLMRALRNVGARCPADQQIALECQGSSIGRYNADWVDAFRRSAQGGPYDEWFDLTPKQRTTLQYPPPERLKILFPARDTVERAGIASGGSFFFTPSFWQAANFPRANFHDSNAVTGNLLMHTKPKRTIEVAKSKSSQGTASGVDPSVGGWIYIGSHNFTPSAWGTLNRPKTKKKNTKAKAKATKRDDDHDDSDGDNDDEPHITMRNYELGIVFPLPKEGFEQAATEVACWRRPAQPYGGREPWMQKLHMQW
ncbi:phospholipase D/nuclease [Clavulina sp. PMI_390]|nr:phospholipase D/nuclease [Clavulina sp. PMI_390]